MVKNMFIYLVVIVVVGIAGWFFVSKMQNVSKNSDINSIVLKNSETTATLSPGTESQEKEWTKLPNGLKIKDISVGYGQEAHEGDVVATHYIGTLEDGTKFDSSYDRDHPFSFVLGGGMVIKGWDLGLVGMKVGGKRKLIIPSGLGYGNRNVGNGTIPPNSTLYFDIELVAVETPTAK